MTAPVAETGRGVARAALDQWGMSGADLVLVSHTENLVFRVDGPAGRFALRVHRPGYHTLAELESEAMWIEALAAAGFGVPVAAPTTSGSRYAVVEVPGSAEVRHVGLVPWFDGITLGALVEQAPDGDRRDDCFRQLGEILARLHEHGANWEPPAAFRRHVLDADGFVGTTPFWGRFWEVPALSTAQRSHLGEGRRRLYHLLTDYGTDPRTFSVIHADLCSGNVMVTGGGVQVIDFDDAGFGWHMYDVAVALYDHADSPDFEAVRRALLDGYSTHRSLAGRDLAMLPVFLAVRACALLGWLSERPEVGSADLLDRQIDRACRAVSSLPPRSPPP